MNFQNDDFKKSSLSWLTSCVEVAQKDSVIAVRDSKNPSGARLYFNREEWNAFIGGVKKGEFD